MSIYPQAAKGLAVTLGPVVGVLSLTALRLQYDVCNSVSPYPLLYPLFSRMLMADQLSIAASISGQESKVEVLPSGATK
jgi:hypothetical protein